MGVNGLHSYIERNGHLNKNFHLHHTQVVIDANNIMNVLARKTRRGRFSDHLGGDMVAFGSVLKEFYSNLRRCNIEPILVFDGAQTYDQIKSKIPEKIRRGHERFLNAKSICSGKSSQFVLPISTTMVFKSIALDNGVRIVLSTFEADEKVAMLARDLDCPIISDDSDFYLMNLPRGVISSESICEYKIIKIFENQQDRQGNQILCLKCDLFRAEDFISKFPNLSIECLPILGVLLGNDFLDSSEISTIVHKLPIRDLCHSLNLTTKQFRASGKPYHTKITKLLHFMRGKTRNQVCHEISHMAKPELRETLNKSIREYAKFYDISNKDSDSELYEIFNDKHLAMIKDTSTDKNDHDEKYKIMMFDVVNLVRKVMEHSVANQIILDVINRNPIILRSPVEDYSLPGVNGLIVRGIQLIMALTRASRFDKRTISIYSREANEYVKQTVAPLDSLPRFGSLDLIIYDIPYITRETKLELLLATFGCSMARYQERIAFIDEWFESSKADEVLAISILLTYLDAQSPKLWPKFRTSVLVSLFYYEYQAKKDVTFRKRLAQDEDKSFFDNVTNLFDRRSLRMGPASLSSTKINWRIVHQINQLHSVIVSFNRINAFFDNVVNRIRPENWLNSSLIYNLTLGLHNRKIILTRLPKLIEYLLHS